VSVFDNQGFINLKSENIEGFYDLKVMADKRKGHDTVCIEIKDMHVWFTIEEIEALHNFAQIVKKQ
jgi:hypothetical protein